MKKVVFVFWMLWALGLRGQEARLVLPVANRDVVTSAEFSKDGKFALTTCFDGIARIYEVSSGKELFFLRGDKGLILSAVFSPDDKMILTTESDSTARIYEMNSGKELHNFSGFNSPISFSVYSPDGKLVLIVAEKAFIFNSNTGKLFKVLTKQNDLFNAANFSSDGKYVVMVRYYGTAEIYDVSSGNLLKEFKLSLNTGSAVFSEDSRFLLTAEGKIAKIYEVATGVLTREFKGHTTDIYTAHFDKSNKLVLTFSIFDSIARVYDSESGVEKFILKGHSDVLFSAVFSPDSKFALTSSYDKSARVFDLTDGKEVLSLKHSGSVNSAVFSKDSKLILTASNDKVGRVYNATTGKILKVLGHLNSFWSTDLCPDNRHILTVNSDSIARKYNLFSGRLVSEYEGNEKEIYEAVFSPDNKLVVTECFDKSNKIFDAVSGKLLHDLKWKNELDGLLNDKNLIYYTVFSKDTKYLLLYPINAYWDFNHPPKVEGIAGIFNIANSNKISILRNSSPFYKIVFSPDNKFALTYSLDSTNRIYDVMTGKELFVINKDSSGYLGRLTRNSNVFSNDGRFFIASDHKAVRIYEASSGKEIQVLKGYEGHLHDAFFSPDGKLVITIDDKSAKIYESFTEKEPVIIPNNYIISAVLSPDGKFLLTAGRDRAARIYDVITGKELKVFTGNTAIYDAVFCEDKFIFTKTNHGTILWDAATGRQLYTRLQLKNGDWLVFDEHYRYDGTQGARDYLYFACGLEVVDLAQVKDALYVPNLVQRIMNGENLDHLPKLKDLEICGVTPEVEPLDNKKDGGNYYQIKSRKGGVGKVEIYINGMLRQTLDSKSLSQKDGIFELKIDEKIIQQYQIADKETEIKVVARTADNKISSRGSIRTSSRPAKIYQKPNLHAIMVGIDDYKGSGLDLNYAAKDAIDLQTALKISTQKLFNVDDTNRVHFYNLTLDRAGNINGLTPDRNNILKTLDKIEKESKPEDVFLLFFAGHGEINPDKQLILLTAEASKEQAPNYSGILMKELLEKLAKIPAGKRILLLDACHSGAAINELNIKDIAGVRDGEDAEKQSQRLKELENLASKSGLAIITASSTDQKALELPQYEHGLMTYALLTTMLNDPEVLDKDNNLQLEDWLRQTEKNVSKLIENQSAQRFVPVNFSVGKVDDAVRKSIVLQEIPTLVVGNVYNRDLDDDNLKIKQLLSKKLNEISSRGGTNKILIAKEDSPNAIIVNLPYEIVDGKIKSKINLKKDNMVFKQFNFEGNAADLNKFVEELSKEITKNLK